MELETAVERLYTDESLAADVDDKTAVPLLKWAESVLPVLVARGDEGFDDAFVTLKKLIKSVARLIDMRGEIDVTERAERAEKIQGFAQELGIIVNVDHLESLASIDGPEIVAQMVGPVAAFSVPLPSSIEAGASSAEVVQEADTTTTQTDLQEQAAVPTTSDSPVTESVKTEMAPDDKVKAWFIDNDEAPATNPIPALPGESQADSMPSQAETAAYEDESQRQDAPVAPLEEASTEEPQPPAEKSSLLDGIGAFFQRVGDRLDPNKNTDHQDDKE